MVRCRPQDRFIQFFYWIITKSRKQISDANVQHVTAEDMGNPDIKEALDQFGKDLRQILYDTVGNQLLSHHINCPMFGFQSHLPSLLFRIHEWII